MTEKPEQDHLTLNQMLGSGGFDDALLCEFGRFMVMFSKLEFAVEHALWRITQVDPIEIGPHLTGVMNADRLFRQFGEIVQRFFKGSPSDKEALVEVIGSLEQIRQTRNKYAHGLWVAKSPIPQVYYRRPIDQKMTSSSATPKRFRVLSKFTWEAARDITMIVNDSYGYGPMTLGGRRV